MEWKQTGGAHRSDFGEGYGIVKHEQDGKQWFTLEYGAE
jgi:hypothetical protein